MADALVQSRPRGVETAFDAPVTLEGEGFEVRRPIPSGYLLACGPVILLDHIGPTVVGPGQAKGAPTHPHAGLETLTYLLEGRAHHLDSLGNSSSMGPGEVQWMRAGRGIIHDEGPDHEFKRTGGRVHGVQLWIDLPRPHRHGDPEYRHYEAADIPLHQRDGAAFKVIAGEFDGIVGPVRTFAQPLVVHATMTGGSSPRIEATLDEFALYVMVGRISVGTCVAEVGQFLLLGEGESVDVFAMTDSEIMILGGSRLAKLPVRAGPFVMDDADELDQALRAFRRGDFGLIDRLRA